MAEERLDDSFPELKEVENKIGRKTPESLLMWMRDAADCGDGWRADVVDSGDQSSGLSGGFSDKISSLKQEMRWLRSADVRILRQLVAVHEGIEAMRWLMEERGALVSRGSSLTGSLSSLVTVEEGPSGTPCRESPSPTCPHTDDGDSDHKSYFDVLSPESTEVGPHSPSNFNSEVSGSTHGRPGLASSNPANGSVGASLQKSQPQDLDTGPFEDMKAGTIRRALLRSNRPRNKVDTGSFTLAQESGETQTEDSLPQESFEASQNKMMEEESSPPDGEKLLLGYDAQWCWVESQDDVTFL